MRYYSFTIGISTLCDLPHSLCILFAHPCTWYPSNLRIVYYSSSLIFRNLPLYCINFFKINDPLIPHNQNLSKSKYHIYLISKFTSLLPSLAYLYFSCSRYVSTSWVSFHSVMPQISSCLS